MRELVEERKLAFTTWCSALASLSWNLALPMEDLQNTLQVETWRAVVGLQPLLGVMHVTPTDHCASVWVRGRTAWLCLHLLHCEEIAAFIKGLRTGWEMINSLFRCHQEEPALPVTAASNVYGNILPWFVEALAAFHKQAVLQHVVLQGRAFLPVRSD